MSTGIGRWELLARLFESMASDARASVALWKTDPEKYGEGDHADWIGRASALTQAAELVRQVAYGDEE
mgnify:CR=1 FL=1